MNYSKVLNHNIRQLSISYIAVTFLMNLLLYCSFAIRLQQNN